MIQFQQGELFREFNLGNSRQASFPNSRYNARKNQVLNLQLHNGFATEGEYGMPMLSPFTGDLPRHFIPFTERNNGAWSCGIHCYLYDYMLEILWERPIRVIPCLKRSSCVIAPDFSVFVDQPRAINIWNIYRNRWIASFWQNEGIPVIPSASWGNVDSFGYCFDGLPENSVIAIGHVVTGRDASYKKLYRMGVEALIARKNPTLLLVYGAPLDYSPNVDVVYYEGFIQKLRKL